MLPRSYLFVPADRPDRLAKALASAADAVVVDLEDAVAEDAKSRARDALAGVLRTLAEGDRKRLVVRINAAASPHFDGDVALLQQGGAAAVMLPKAEDPGTLLQLRQHGPGLTLLPLVESAVGMQGAAALAAVPGVQRLVFGTLDYALDLDLGPGPQALDAGHAQLALVSRAAGIAAPVAGVTPAFDDPAALLADWAQARSHGFAAKLCIHPQQLGPLHAAMAPTEAELNWARQVLQAASGAGAVQVNGRMVDKPVVQRAQRLLQRAAP